jgi:hypothetical protein
MAKKDAYSIGNDNAFANGEQDDRTAISSWPKPEEGLQLMHAFLDIRQPELRNAIIKFVAELSRVEKNG